MSLRSKFSGSIHQLLARYGRQVVRSSPPYLPGQHRRAMMAREKISLVLDVGANIGQTGEELREEGYTGRIVSFEPIKSVYDQLHARASADGKWHAIHTALGTEDGAIEINVAGFNASSSILPMLEAHENLLPESKYIGKEKVPIAPLDTYTANLINATDRVLLKIDTQGYELNVLKGATQTLTRVILVHLEVSLTALYDGQPHYYDVMRYLDEQGFDMIGFTPGFYDGRTARFLQGDGLFARRHA